MSILSNAESDLNLAHGVLNVIRKLLSFLKQQKVEISDFINAFQFELPNYI